MTASNLSDANVVSGRGFAMSNVDNTNYYAQNAAIADVSVNKKTGKITVKHVYQATSGGLSVGLDLVANQIVGGVTQTAEPPAGRAVPVRQDERHEHRLRLATRSCASRRRPMVTPIVVQRTSDQPRGVGEPVAIAAAAAVANAFFDATGVRLYTAPFTPARVRAALKAAGGAA